MDYFISDREFSFNSQDSTWPSSNYKIGNILEEFVGLRRWTLKISYNKKSIDILFGIIGEDQIDMWNEELNIDLFQYNDIPCMTLWNGHGKVSCFFNVNDIEEFDVVDWLNETCEDVNLVFVDIFKKKGEVLFIRRLHLPILNKIREILKNQYMRYSKEEFEFQVDQLILSFSDYARNKYKDNRIRYYSLSSIEPQKASYEEYQPVDKEGHIDPGQVNYYMMMKESGRLDDWRHSMMKI